jgi:hypothetical protein
MCEVYNKMSYGLVRQVGPWPLTAADLRKVMAPPDPDPIDFQSIRPNVVRDGYEFSQRSAIADRTVMMPMEIDPRISLPGRRVSMNRALGSKRQPLEGQGALKALSGSSGLALKVDPETGRIVDDQFLQEKSRNEKAVKEAYDKKVKEMIDEYNKPGEKRKLTGAEMGGQVLQGVGDVLPYMIPFVGPFAGMAANAAYNYAAPYIFGNTQ